MTLYHNPTLIQIPDKFRFRSEAHYDDARILVILYGGKKAFLYQKDSDTAYDVSDDRNKIFPLAEKIGRFNSLLAFYRKKSIVNYEIEDTFRGEKSCYKIKMTFKPTEETMNLWSKFPPEEQARRLKESWGSAWIIVDKGTMFPYSWSSFDNSGKQVMFIDFGEVEVVPGLDEELFELPKGMEIEKVSAKELPSKIAAA